VRDPELVREIEPETPLDLFRQLFVPSATTSSPGAWVTHITRNGWSRRTRPWWRHPLT